MKSSINKRINYLKLITAKVNQTEAKTDFDIWFGRLNPSSPENAGRIQEVTPTDPYYQPFRKRPRGSPIPVCIVESTTATPSKNWMDKENAFVFKFADFSGQIYNTDSERLDYCKSVLRKHTSFSKENYYLEKVDYNNVDNNISNSEYTSCFAVFALDN